MRSVLFLLIFTSISFSGFVQGKAEKALEKLYNDYPQERIIFSLTKKDFIPGETIFYKAYILIAYELSDLSTNLYLELYDSNKKLLEKDIVPIYKGVANGTMELPSSLPEGIYYLRAYTKWMLNFPDESQYFDYIKIYNINSKNKLQLKPVQWIATAHPEGQQLINGIPAKLAIRLSSEGSYPENWTATLFEEGNTNPLASTNSLNPQVALLQFTPKSNKKYQVRITDNAGNEKLIDVNRVKAEGATMIVYSRPGKIDYEIYFKGSTTMGAGYKIVAQMQNQVAYSAIIKKGQLVVKGSISTSKLVNGVLHLTLFDENEIPVAERLCFVDPLKLTINTPVISFDTLSLSSKALNSWKIEQDSITWYTYSMQVSDAFLSHENNFISSYFLTADVSKSVYNSNWYFEDMDEIKASALDALLITEEFNHFSWNKVLQGQFPEITFPAEQNYLLYKATVTRSKKVQPEKMINILLRLPDSSTHFLQVPTDKEGNFFLADLTFTDSARIYYQQNKQGGFSGPVSIKLERLNTFYLFKSSLPSTPYTLVPRTTASPLPPHIVRAIETKQNFKDVTDTYKVLENVTVSAPGRKATEELDNKLSTGMFRTADAMIFDFINENYSASGHMDVIEWLQGRVPGLYIQYNNGVPTPVMRGSVPALFINEMQADIETLRGLAVSEIAMIKVIRGIFLGSAGGSTGAIAIYTLRGDTRQAFNSSSLPNNVIAGYKKPSEFFSPDYSKRFMENISDRRDILHRSDLLIPNDKSEAVVRFYNNQITQSFRVIITGITNNAEPVYLERIISVKD